MMVRGFLATPVPNDIAYSPATVARSIGEGLTAAGHKVTFYGPEGTDLDVTNIETCGLRPLAVSQKELDALVGTADLFENYRFALADTLLARTMLERAKSGEYDVVLFHHFESVLPLCPLFPGVPIVHVLHDFIDPIRREVIEAHASPNQHFISISDNQRRGAPDLNYAGTVYNGIDTDFFVPAKNPERENYVLFSGRITPAKGVREAIQAARDAKVRLLIAGSLSRSDQWYYDEHVKPYLDDKVLFLGMLGRDQLVKYYQTAAALLVPIQWEEPFGLTMAEAGACGTPVIAFRRGSVPEVVQDGVSGYIVDNSAEMILAIEKLSKLSRKKCREHAVAHFSLARMIDGYDQVLTRIVTPPSSRIRRPNAARSLQRKWSQIKRPLAKKTAAIAPIKRNKPTGK